ncbi:hypothetical protein BH20PSE1_BH20PSE1_13620 [soil metagenome]
MFPREYLSIGYAYDDYSIDRHSRMQCAMLKRENLSPCGEGGCRLSGRSLIRA